MCCSWHFYKQVSYVSQEFALSMWIFKLFVFRTYLIGSLLDLVKETLPALSFSTNPQADQVKVKISKSRTLRHSSPRPALANAATSQKTYPWQHHSDSRGNRPRVHLSRGHWGWLRLISADSCNCFLRKVTAQPTHFLRRALCKKKLGNSDIRINSLSAASDWAFFEDLTTPWIPCFHTIEEAWGRLSEPLHQAVLWKRSFQIQTNNLQ